MLRRVARLVHRLGRDRLEPLEQIIGLGHVRLALGQGAGERAHAIEREANREHERLADTVAGRGYGLHDRDRRDRRELCG
jgi:hypothetical protein